jgi:hypothetical protein
VKIILSEVYDNDCSNSNRHVRQAIPVWKPLAIGFSYLSVDLQFKWLFSFDIDLNYG